MTPDEWRARGSDLVTVDGRIFVTELGAANDAHVPVLVLHGFPSCSWDFDESAAIVARDRRVVLFDFLGYGLSAKPRAAAYSLFEQADVACAVAKAKGLERVHLWAHDMGTSVATELLARRERGVLPFEIASVVLMNGSVHIDMAKLTPGQKLLRSSLGDLFARVAGRKTFGLQMKRIFAKAPSEETLDAMWGLVAREDGTHRLPQLIRYNDERRRFTSRWIGALHRLDLPLLVAWGARDPIAVLAIGERLARETKGAELVRWDDLGHYPQMEDPARVAAVVGKHFTAHSSMRTSSAFGT